MVSWIEQGLIEEVFGTPMGKFTSEPILGRDNSLIDEKLAGCNECRNDVIVVTTIATMISFLVHVI